MQTTNLPDLDLEKIQRSIDKALDKQFPGATIIISSSEVIDPDDFIAAELRPLRDEISGFCFETRRLRDVPGYPPGRALWRDVLAFIAEHGTPEECTRAQDLRARLVEAETR
jgi:hypothetical protein